MENSIESTVMFTKMGMDVKLPLYFVLLVGWSGLIWILNSNSIACLLDLVLNI